MYFGWLDKKATENYCINVVKKSFLGLSQVLEFFSTTWNDQNFLLPRALRKSFIGMNSCVLVDYTRKQPKIAVSMSSKKVFWVCQWFSSFFRLLETTENFFYLGLSESSPSWWIYVFRLITQENNRKLLYQCRQKKFFGSISGSRFFFDYLKRPKFSFT